MLIAHGHRGPLCGRFGRLSTGIRWSARIREQIEKEPAEGGADSILQPEGELSSTHTYNNSSFLVFFDFSLPSESILLDCLRGKLSSLLCVVMKAFLNFLGQFSEVYL